MLVLSRGRNDKVVFPTLGISVEILRVSGSKVRLGIEAPAEIPVHRQEVSERMTANGETGLDTLKFPATSESRKPRLSHSMRNRLNAAALGLHLLHKNIEIGDLSDSETTIFNIFNELKKIESELEGAPPATPAHTEAAHRRALVVEDDDNIRELLASYLRVSGFEVATASDGLQAMVRMTENAPDVVLLDILMPKFDGRKTISAIRANPDYRKTKLFAVTGTKPEETGITVGPNGVDRWFTKPLNETKIQKLMDAIRDDVCAERVLA